MLRWVPWPSTGSRDRPPATLGSTPVRCTRVVHPSVCMSPAEPATGGSGILERGSELQAIRDALERAATGEGRLVVVEGEAGIGKSTILQAALHYAAAAGLRALHTTGSELEQHYSYGVAISLFEPLLRATTPSQDELFTGVAANTRPLFDAELDARSGAADPFATILGLYWLALNAAERGSIVLAVDDAQWADAASLRYFDYLARRASELPIVLVLAFRSGVVAADEAAATQLRNSGSALRLRLAPLSEAAVGELLAASGEDPTDVGLRRDCWTASGGNPFFATELVRDVRRGVLSHGDGAAGVGSLVPDRIARHIEARIARLDRPGQRLAEAVAILGEEATLPRAAVLATLSEPEAAELVRQLTHAAILTTTGSVSFTHPIIRSAVYQSMPEAIRSRLHREAGLMLQGEGLSVGVVAGQLLAAEARADPRVVAILRDAARQARSRGDSSVAVRQLRRAMEEPPRQDQLVDVIVELARAEAAVAASSAVVHFDQALGLVEGRHLQAELLLDLGKAQINAADWPGAVASFERGARLVGDDEPELRSRLETGALSAAWVGTDRRGEQLRRIDKILANRKLGPDDRQLEGWIELQRALTGRSTAAVASDFANRVVAETPIEVMVNQGRLIEAIAGLLVATDNLSEDIDFLTRALDAVSQAGSYGQVGMYSYYRAWPHYYVGRLADAVEDAQAALRISELGWETFYPATYAVMTLAMIERAELDAADAVLQFDERPWAGRIDTAMLIPLARGRLHLARGRLGEALVELRASGAYCAAIGRQLQIPTDSLSSTVEVLVRLNRRDEAREVAHELLLTARAWGARWPLGIATAAAGLAEGGPRGIDMLREAVTLLQASPARLELTRALVTLGAALRRHGSLNDAHDVLARGMDLAYRCGAIALAERSRAELMALGLRPRRYVARGAASLTPAERRVAELAAGGRTNREVAQALFVTPKAVEFHLANAYRKLEIGSRRELPTALESGA